MLMLKCSHLFPMPAACSSKNMICDKDMHIQHSYREIRYFRHCSSFKAKRHLRVREKFDIILKKLTWRQYKGSKKILKLTYMTLLVSPEKAMGAKKNDSHIKFSLSIWKHDNMEHFYLFKERITHCILYYHISNSTKSL